MLNRYFGSQIHSHIHLFLLCALAFSIPLSKFVMSLGMMLLALNWLLEGGFAEKWNRIKSNRLFLWLAAFYLLHALSILWSHNLAYGFHDLRVKAPLLVIPLILVSKPQLLRDSLKWILAAFAFSTVMVSIINFGSYMQWFGPHFYDDIRGMSLFDSHVRFSLFVVFALVALFQLWRWKYLGLIPFLILFVWLHFYTYYSQVLSGTVALIGVYFTFGFYVLYQKSRSIAFGSLFLILFAVVAGLAWIFTPMTYDKSVYNFENLAHEQTAEGHFYAHSPDEICPETGKPIDIFVSHEELRREWNKVSDIPFDMGRDAKGQLIFRTLVRYMASMDLRKDAEGFTKLTQTDIRAIELGQTSQDENGLRSRINGLRFQITNTVDPNGHSFLQRVEYWRVGTGIAADNYLVGIGIGDVQDEFNKAYKAQNSLLTEEHRDRAHNFYLTILLSLGILGLLILLGSHFDFLRVQFFQGELVGIAFLIIMAISYLVEDTLETQSAVTFFSLIYGLYAFYPKKAQKT